MAYVCHDVGVSLGVPLELVGVMGNFIPLAESLRHE
jgi:hypothetical protein